MPPPGLPRHAGCGSCGYELTELAAGRCSECGADLLKAGVTTRRNAVRLAGSLPAALTGWTLLVMGAAVILIYVVSMAMLTNSTRSQMNNYTASYTYRPALSGPPAAGSAPTPNLRVRLDLDVENAWRTRPSSGVVTMELSASSSIATFTFPDASRDDWELTDGTGTTLASGSALRPDDVLVGFRAVGLDPDADPVLRDYADRVEELAAGALGDPMGFDSAIAMRVAQLPTGTPRFHQISGTSGFGAGASPFGSMSLADAIVPAVTLGVACGVWLAGAVFIVRRRARLIEGPRPTPMAS